MNKDKILDIVKSKNIKPSAPSDKSISKKINIKKHDFTIGQLEKRLLSKFPKEVAEAWDKTGLLVGDRDLPVKKIAITLDPTVKAIKLAKNSDCNVLLTHHPAYLGGVENFFPGDSNAKHGGATVYEAIYNEVALMNFHTALDASPEGLSILPRMLKLKKKTILCPNDGQTPDKANNGFGMINTTKSFDKNITLEQLAARCKSVFCRDARVWGDFDRKLKTIVTTTGSVGRLSDGDPNILRSCIEKNVDCLICGEIKYHDALSLSDYGICIIELGHDVSELPLVGVLANALCDCDVDMDNVIIIDQTNNWKCLSSTMI